MVINFTHIVCQAYGLSKKEWAALPQESKLERIADHLAAVLEVHEARLQLTTGPAAAYRAEFGHLAPVLQVGEDKNRSMTGIVAANQKRINQNNLG